MNIRLATDADVPTLRDLARRIWHASYPGIITQQQIEYMLAWMYAEAMIREEMRKGYTWELIEVEGEPIGFQAYHRENDGRCKLDKLYLLPEHQGRGFAITMLTHIRAAAREMEAREVWLQVNKQNKRAIAAYQKAGFHLAGENVFSIGDGFVMDDYLMAVAV